MNMLTKVLGIIGGGQLGMMITEAAKKMPEHISKIIVLDPTENCPAAQVGAEQIVADFKNKDAIVNLANKSDIITYEIESGDSDVLKSNGKNPSPAPPPPTMASAPYIIKRIIEIPDNTSGGETIIELIFN